MSPHFVKRRNRNSFKCIILLEVQSLEKMPQKIVIYIYITKFHKLFLILLNLKMCPSCTTLEFSFFPQKSCYQNKNIVSTHGLSHNFLYYILQI